MESRVTRRFLSTGAFSDEKLDNKGWERIMREIDGAAPSTVRRRLAALSSLFKHLVRHNHVEKNPVSEVGHTIRTHVWRRSGFMGV